MPFAAALSRHPVAADAVGEVLGRIVELGGIHLDGADGSGPDLVVVFASAAHVEFLGEITNAISVVLSPGTVIGSAATAVSACGEAVDDGPALAVWAAWIGPVQPLRLSAVPVEAVAGDEIQVGVSFAGLPPDIEFGSTVVVLADPHTFPAGPFAAHVSDTRPGVVVAGGLSSASDEPQGNAVVLDGDVHRDGAVAVVIGPGPVTASMVSQGGRPVGEPMVVTKADRNFVLELAGQPALDMFHRTIEDLELHDRAKAKRGLLLGVVTDEVRDDFGHGDFLVRPIIGADRRAGVLAVPEPIAVGQTVQFQLQDAAVADTELRALLGEIDGDAALVFASSTQPSTSAADLSIAEQLDTTAVAAMFATGELGPLGGRSFLHSHATSVVVFADE